MVKLIQENDGDDAKVITVTNIHIIPLQYVDKKSSASRRSWKFNI